MDYFLLWYNVGQYGQTLLSLRLLYPSLVPCSAQDRIPEHKQVLVGEELNELHF